MHEVQIGHDFNYAQGDIVQGDEITSNVTGAIIHGSVVTAGQIIYNNPVAEPKAEISPEVDLYHLPEPTTALIGRKTELAQLTEAIKNPNKRLAIIVAAGGIGKSALTDEWLKQIEAHNYYGKTRIFGWSFYSQGSHNTFTNSQPFFSAVFGFLNKYRPKDGKIKIPKDESKKAQLLVQCLCDQPCLLILDGLEPLQYAENLQSMNGELQDSGLKAFVACFRRTAGKSFVLFSSRQPLVELKKWQADHFLSLDLKTLPHDDGAALLQSLGVTGKTEELQAISQDLNGHALSLVLFGHLLSKHHQGDCRYAKELDNFPLYQRGTEGDFTSSDAEKDSRHALRVLDYYDSLQDEASRCFLQLLGLFDRPIGRKEKAVLVAEAQHAEPLRVLTVKQWQKIEQQLEKGSLLLGKKGSAIRLEWDTHPIIRSYFGQKFKDKHPEAFKQAHLVLFEYYQKLPEKEFPDTLEEMLPLYRAVVHGCLGGGYQQAFEIYWKRICKNAGENNNKVYYSLYKLGAYSQDLTALMAFFPLGWEMLESNLTEMDEAELLAIASFCLMSLGHLPEAIEPRIANLNLRKKQGDWKNTAIAARNLVDSYLPLGQLNKAYVAAEQAIIYAQLSENTYSQMVSQSYLAAVYHREGHIHKAFKYFQQAEVLEQERYLSSLVGFWYCDLLLASAQDKSSLQVVLARAKYSLEIGKHLLSMALDHLTIARVTAALNEPTQAENYFEQGIQDIQKANMAQYTSPFHLYRADFYITKNKLDPALADLNSAWDIIDSCGMNLYLVDYLLIHGRYCLATADIDTALNHYEEAKQLITDTGYHLRDAELDLFAAKLCQQHGNIAGKTAADYLQKAKNRIAEIGQWGLMRVIERDFPEETSQ